MKLIPKGLVGALIAVLACGALTAASASAAPNYPEFAVTFGGHFPVTLTGTSGALDFYESTGGIISCNNSSISGEIINSKEVAKVKLTFSEGMYCSSEYFCSGHAGSWETTTLKGRIAYITKSSKRVGVLLEPVTQPF